MKKLLAKRCAHRILRTYWQRICKPKNTMLSCGMDGLKTLAKKWTRRIHRLGVFVVLCCIFVRLVRQEERGKKKLWTGAAIKTERWKLHCEDLGRFVCCLSLLLFLRFCPLPSRRARPRRKAHAHKLRLDITIVVHFSSVYFPPRRVASAFKHKSIMLMCERALRTCIFVVHAVLALCAGH